MADDLDKEDKGTQLQTRYDKLMAAISAKDMNISPLTVNALKEQIIALSQLAGLVGISLDIGALESALTVREAELEVQHSKTVKEVYANKELTKEEQARVIREKEVGEIYKKFDSFHEPYLKEQKEDNKNLDKVLEATEAGRELTEEEKKKLKKTPEQIEEERLRWQHIALTNKEAEEEHKYHSENIEKINREILNLDPHHHHVEITDLAQKKKHHEHHRDLAKIKKTECAEHYHERSEQAKKIYHCAERATQKGVNEDILQERMALFRGVHGISVEEIAKGTKTERVEKAVLESKKKLDEQQIISDSNKIPNKLSENLTKQFIKNFSEDKPSIRGSETISPPPKTPINLKDKEQNKGKIVRRSID